MGQPGCKLSAKQAWRLGSAAFFREASGGAPGHGPCPALPVQSRPLKRAPQKVYAFRCYPAGCLDLLARAHGLRRPPGGPPGPAVGLLVEWGAASQYEWIGLWCKIHGAVDCIEACSIA
jgi:hypothetical protein